MAKMNVTTMSNRPMPLFRVYMFVFDAYVCGSWIRGEKDSTRFWGHRHQDPLD